MKPEKIAQFCEYYPIPDPDALIQDDDKMPYDLYRFGLTRVDGKSFFVRCSECGGYFPRPQYAKFKFCPLCGLPALEEIRPETPEERQECEDLYLKYLYGDGEEV